MKTLFKALLLQLLWYILLRLIASGHALPAFLLGALYYVFDEFYFPKSINKINYYFLTAVTVIYGVLHESLQFYLGLIGGLEAPLSMLAFWPVFATYFKDLFVNFPKPVIFRILIGGFGGALAYYSGIQMSKGQLHSESLFYFITYNFISYAIIFPFLLWLSKDKKFINRFLDYTIIFSFDRTGFLRHLEEFANPLDVAHATGKRALVTGGTSGIGQSVANWIKSSGGEVTITGRNSPTQSNLNFVQLDMADWKGVIKYVNRLTEPFHTLVFNAGGMPLNYETNQFGIELQWASQLAGHYILLKHLINQGKLRKGSRIVWVSSGGMYLKKLELAHCNKANYDKVKAYANTKRAQVTLVELLSKMEGFNDFINLAMHPGWVDTPGLSGALPKFHNLTKKFLRDTSMGADTIKWLISADPSRLQSGSLYFDRRVVSPYISKSFVPTPNEKKSLLALLERYYQMSLA